MKKFYISTLMAFSSFALMAQSIQVNEPWVRATVAGQKATGAFLTISSKEAVKLVEVKSTAAAIVEIHEMAMTDNVMKMRRVNDLDIPAGKSVELKPGSFHIMLMDLINPVAAGSNVPLTLVFKGAEGKVSKIEINAKAKAMNGQAQAKGEHSQAGTHGHTGH